MFLHPISLLKAATGGGGGSAPSIVNSASTNGGTGSSIAATLPGSLTSGNHLIAFVSNPDLFATNAPSGWTQFLNVTPGHANYNEIYGFWREIDGSEGATQTFSGDWKNRCAVVYEVDNLPSTPTFTVGSSSNNSSGTITAPSMTAVADDLLFTIMGNRSTVVMSPTEDYAVSSGTTRFSIRADANQSAGATGAETSVSSADWWYGVQVTVQ